MSEGTVVFKRHEEKCCTTAIKQMLVFIFCVVFVDSMMCLGRRKTFLPFSLSLFCGGTPVVSW